MSVQGLVTSVLSLIEVKCIKNTIEVNCLSGISLSSRSITHHIISSKLMCDGNMSVLHLFVCLSHAFKTESKIMMNVTVFGRMLRYLVANVMLVSGGD